MAGELEDEDDGVSGDNGARDACAGDGISKTSPVETGGFELWAREAREKKWDAPSLKKRKRKRSQASGDMRNEK